MKRVQTNSSFDVQLRPFARHSCVARSRSVNDVEVCSASLRWLSFSEASEDETANYRQVNRRSRYAPQAFKLTVGVDRVSLWARSGGGIKRRLRRISPLHVLCTTS